MRFPVVCVSHAIGIKWIELHCKSCLIAPSSSSCEEYLLNLKRAAMLKTTSSSWYSIKAVIEAKGNQQQYVSTANLFIDHVGGKRNDRRCQTPTNISTACPATSGLQVFLTNFFGTECYGLPRRYYEQLEIFEATMARLESGTGFGSEKSVDPINNHLFSYGRKGCMQIFITLNFGKMTITSALKALENNFLAQRNGVSSKESSEKKTVDCYVHRLGKLASASYWNKI